METSTLRSDVITAGSIVNDLATASFHVQLKDQGSLNIVAEPSPTNQVVIDRYHVEYRRADGRNTPGVDVPFAFDSALTLAVAADPVSGAFQIVRHTAKAEAPLAALAQNSNIISTIATVTFYGHDLAGNDISASANMGVDFANFADN